MTTNHSLAAEIWLYKGDHRLIIHHQTLDDEKPAFKWEELPRDVIASILSRLGPAELLTRVQYVCRTWWDICWDPLMWRRVRFGDLFDEAYPYNYLRDRYAFLYPRDDDDDYDHIKWRAWHWRRRWFLGREDVYSCLDRLCLLAVDRSLGGLESITLHLLASDDLLHYVAHRSYRLKHLQLTSSYRVTEEGLISVAAQVPFLEKLELTLWKVTKEVIEAFARSCPLLISIKLMHSFNVGTAGAIAQGMPQLIHLQLGVHLTNDELKAILDGCPRLESLDLYGCYGLILDSELGLRCAKQIKEFRGPYVAADDDDYRDYYSDDSEYYGLTPTEYTRSSDGEFEDGDYCYQDNYDDYDDDDITLN